jgi:hypothetical protein
MKKPFLARLFRRKKDGDSTKCVATTDDIRKKLENYQSKDGPASFGSARVYSVTEVERQRDEELSLEEDVSNH